MDEHVAEELAAENPALIIFTDLGSGYLDLLNEKLSDYPVIILDHHQPTGEPSPTFIPMLLLYTELSVTVLLVLI